MDAIEVASFETSAAVRTRWISLLSTAAMATRIETDRSRTGHDADATNVAVDEAVLALASVPVRTREDMRVLARAVRHAETLSVGPGVSRALLNALLEATIHGP
jgi:hypothetical protein